MYGPLGNFSRYTDIVRKNQMEKHINKDKEYLWQAEKISVKLKISQIEIKQTETHRENCKKKMQNIKEMWYKIKSSEIHAIGNTERQEVTVEIFKKLSIQVILGIYQKILKVKSEFSKMVSYRVNIQSQLYFYMLVMNTKKLK